MSPHRESGTSSGVPPEGSRTIEEILADARTRLDRLTPREARRALDDGAVLVDIRPTAQRAAEGAVPEAVVVEPNMLEWRFDPSSDARLPIAAYDLQVIVMCSAGYISSLAAAACTSWASPAPPTSSAGSSPGATPVSR